MMFLKLRHKERDCKDTTFFTVNKRVDVFFVSLGMKQKLLSLIFATLVFSLPLLSVIGGQPLTDVLKELSIELDQIQEKNSADQQLFDRDYEEQHQRLIEVITASDELSILLYTQEQEMTFDLAYALKKVTTAYRDFNLGRKPYDRIVKELDVEIDRYARLIEALRRLPPVMQEIEIAQLPDSLLRIDEAQDRQISRWASSLEKEVIRIADRDSVPAPFILDREGQAYRDSCLLYASALLKRHADNRAIVMADSIHYQAAYWRMNEANDYALARYRELEKYVFSEGLPVFPDILANPDGNWEKVMADLADQYSFDELNKDNPAAREAAGGDLLSGLSSKGANSMLVVVNTIQLLTLAVFWLLTGAVLWLLGRIGWVKRKLPAQKRPLLTILLGTLLYFVVLGFSIGLDDNEFIRLSARHVNTFLWLLVAVSGSLLLRVNADRIRHSFRLYIPTFVIAILIIVCRICFVPDRLMNFLFPPILALAVLRQLFFCIRERGKAMPVDSALGWTSLAFYLAAFGFSFFGYTFVALLILIWWYFQLATLLTIICLSDLLDRYRQRREDKHAGEAWFFEFLRQAVLPSLFLLSLPYCVHLSLDVFDFDDLYAKIFQTPFVLLMDKEGFETLRISGGSVIALLILFLQLRYLSRAVRACYQHLRYKSFMRKYNRTAVRDNEINLSLGNSIITVLIWMVYAVVVVNVWKIPTGSLSLVAGGLSAGIGLALKDTINNFIYGIQLMGGRLRVGDWIECDGVRGRVVAINYQCVVVETLSGTEMSFLNSSLFGKNFNNLTRNNSYEFTKVTVSVAYGTDIGKVRQTLTSAMQQMRTQDQYGREIVEPTYGIHVVVDDMADSGVTIAVKQYVLVAEIIPFVDRSKEVIYDALNAAGIPIPFPQCDVHLIGKEG